MIRIAIFASGAGTNAEKIMQHFKVHPVVQVALVVTNNAGAGIIKIARDNGVPTLVIEKNIFLSKDSYLNFLADRQIEWIILAGFLWKIPSAIINAYPGKIINIHPALLPKYGGQGMYGHHVHSAVIKNRERESGISIHLVDEIYDHGKIIMQAKCSVNANDDISALAKKIQALEHQYYPTVIEKTIIKAKAALN